MTQKYFERYCPQFARLSESEKDSVLDVVACGQAFGYGNMMAWLLTAWNVRLKEDMPHLKEGELPIPTATTTPYQIKPR